MKSALDIGQLLLGSRATEKCGVAVARSDGAASGSFLSVLGRTATKFLSGNDTPKKTNGASLGQMSAKTSPKSFLPGSGNTSQATRNLKARLSAPKSSSVSIEHDLELDSEQSSSVPVQDIPKKTGRTVAGIVKGKIFDHKPASKTENDVKIALTEQLPVPTIVPHPDEQVAAEKKVSVNGRVRSSLVAETKTSLLRTDQEIENPAPSRDKKNACIPSARLLDRSIAAITNLKKLASANYPTLRQTIVVREDIAGDSPVTFDELEPREAEAKSSTHRRAASDEIRRQSQPVDRPLASKPAGKSSKSKSVIHDKANQSTISDKPRVVQGAAGRVRETFSDNERLDRPTDIKRTPNTRSIPVSETESIPEEGHVSERREIVPSRMSGERTMRQKEAPVEPRVRRTIPSEAPSTIRNESSGSEKTPITLAERPAASQSQGKIVSQTSQSAEAPRSDQSITLPRALSNGERIVVQPEHVHVTQDTRELPLTPSKTESTSPPTPRFVRVASPEVRSSASTLIRAATNPNPPSIPPVAGENIEIPLVASQDAEAIETAAQEIEPKPDKKPGGNFNRVDRFWQARMTPGNQRTVSSPVYHDKAAVPDESPVSSRESESPISPRASRPDRATTLNSQASGKSPQPPAQRDASQSTRPVEMGTRVRSQTEKPASMAQSRETPVQEQKSSPAMRPFEGMRRVESVRGIPEMNPTESRNLSNTAAELRKEPRPVQANGARSVNRLAYDAPARRFWGFRVSEAVPEKIANEETDSAARRFADPPRSVKPTVVTTSREEKSTAQTTTVTDRVNRGERPASTSIAPQATRTHGVKTAAQLPTDVRVPLNHLGKPLTRVDWAGGTRVPSDFANVRPSANNTAYRTPYFAPKTRVASQVESSSVGTHTISAQTETRSFPESRNVLLQPVEQRSAKVVVRSGGDARADTAVKNGRVNVAEVLAPARTVLGDSPRPTHEIPRVTTTQVGVAEAAKVREAAIESRHAESSLGRQTPEYAMANRLSRKDRSPDAASVDSSNVGHEADQRKELSAHRSRPMPDRPRGESHPSPVPPSMERPALENVHPVAARTVTGYARKFRGPSDATRPVTEAFAGKETSLANKTTVEQSPASAQTTSGVSRSTGSLFTMPSAPLRPHLTAEQVRELQQLVVRAVQNTRANAIGESTTRFNLQHASLGLLQFRISTRRDGVAIEISSASHEVTETLDESRPAVERVIADLGMRVERFEIRLREPAALQDNWSRGFLMDREPKRDAPAGDSRPSLYADVFSARDEEEPFARRPLLADHEWVA